MTNSILFLDDSEERCERARSALRCTTVATARACIDELARVHALGQAFETVYLDHDLGGAVNLAYGAPGNGGDVVRWIVEHRPAIELVVVHSLNEPAARAMLADLTAAGYGVERVPFTLLLAHWNARGA